MLSQETRSALEAKYRHLTAAANIIRAPENWCVGRRAHDGMAPHCALGALDRASELGLGEKPRLGIHGDQPIVCDLAENTPVLVHEMKKDPYNFPSTQPWGVVARYNNTSTHTEVIAWFDKTAAGMKCILDADDAERAQEKSHAA